jgi:hypothetical protein
MVPLYLFRPGADGDGQGAAAPRGASNPSPEREPLAFRVELWDADKSRVERTLALTADVTIGYAAYFAATQEFPDRYITLSDKSRIVTRWNGPVQ